MHNLFLLSHQLFVTLISRQTLKQMTNRTFVSTVKSAVESVLSAGYNMFHCPVALGAAHVTIQLTVHMTSLRLFDVA